MKITSSVFTNEDFIPRKYTCEGQNINPPLTFSEIPIDAKSLVLIVEDPDAPGKVFTHWLVYDIPSSVLQILENSEPAGSMEGMNDHGEVGYAGPCPPSEIHRYFFKIFALDIILDSPPKAEKREVEEKMKGHILDSASLIGLYEKTTQPEFEQYQA